MDKQKWIYFLIRAATYPLRWFPYSWIHSLGRFLGSIGYHFMRDYRKRALSNLALATDLSLSPQEIVQIAKESFQNLAINCLEYAKLSAAKTLSQAIQCENPEVAASLYEKGHGIIFFCGHLSNWEVLFLDGTSRMKGVAIGKSIKNHRLYQWIVSIRQKNGGQIIAPHNALREGLKNLRKGIFLGIVGDQAMPDSGYCSPFLGRRAWTSTAPALLAYKTGSPLIFAETRRVQNGYRIHYSNPIWPDSSKNGEEEVARIMNELLALLEKSIKKSPGEWLWQHNRWKQQTPNILYKRFRQDCLCIVMPQNGELFQQIAPHLQTLKQIYPLAFLSLYVPKKCCKIPLIEADEIVYYENIEETLSLDYRFKLLFDFAGYPPLKSHYEKLGAFEVLDLPALQTLAAPNLPENLKDNYSEIFKRALCRPNSLWKKET